jgi:hypothetical protein
VGGATGDHLQDSLVESTLSDVQTIARRLNRRLGAVALVAVLLSKIADVLDVWNIVLDMVRLTPGPDPVVRRMGLRASGFNPPS